MMSKSVSDSSSNPHRDDAYWSALFDQESSIQRSSVEKTATNGQWSPAKEPTEQDQNFALDHSISPWEQAQELFDNEEAITLKVTGFNKGGLLVDWHTLQGFVPASQLVNFPQFHLESERMRALRDWVDKELPLKIIELNQESNRLIFSERAAHIEAGKRDNVLNRIQNGDNIRGTVTNLTKFGAFVDLGGVEGLIHISELSWSRVLHPSDVVKPGQAVEVTILSVDQGNGRVALSLKRLKKDPWQYVSEKYQEGQLVEGTVSNIVSFGAFVMVEDELEGLIHISELAEGNFLHPRNVVRKGQQIQAKVLSVNGREKRLALTLRGVKRLEN